MNVGEKSDSVVVPEKVLSNDTKISSIRTGPKENGQRAAAVWAQSQIPAPPGLMVVCQEVQRDKEISFSALLHNVDIRSCIKAYFTLKRGLAAGIGGVR